jgi:hypothetical protein
MEGISTAVIYERLNRIGKELSELRRALLKICGAELAKKSPGSLRGIWKGVVIDEEDFAEARVSLHPDQVLDVRR